MSREKQLEGLAQLSAVQFRAAQAEMAALLEQEAALRQNLRELVQSKTALSRAARQPDEAAVVAGADMRWHQWVDQRRAVINIELARVIALKENCRARLKLAFGRDQAIQTLRNQSKETRRYAAQRRQDYES